ncbi:MAG: rod-binding protein [Trichloromonadaceae bacterium]
MNGTIDPKLLLTQTAAAPQLRPAKGNDPEALRKVCQQFEAILTQSLFKGMRATVPAGGLIERGMGTEIFEELMDVELAQSAAQGQGLGIGEALYRQLQGDLPAAAPTAEGPVKP